MKNFFKGFIVGIGKIIPGVSGAMLAITMGIYDKCIHYLNNLNLSTDLGSFGSLIRKQLAELALIAKINVRQQTIAGEILLSNFFKFFIIHNSLLKF